MRFCAQLSTLAASHAVTFEERRTGRGKPVLSECFAHAQTVAADTLPQIRRTSGRRRKLVGVAVLDCIMLTPINSRQAATVWADYANSKRGNIGGRICYFLLIHPPSFARSTLRQLSFLEGNLNMPARHCANSSSLRAHHSIEALTISFPIVSLLPPGRVRMFSISPSTHIKIPLGA